MRIDNLFIAAVRALCHVANVFIDSCAICFRDYLHRYATFAAPCSNSANHTLAPTNTSCSPIALCLSLKRRLAYRPLRHWHAVTQMFQTDPAFFNVFPFIRFQAYLAFCCVFQSTGVDVCRHGPPAVYSADHTNFTQSGSAHKSPNQSRCVFSNFLNVPA